MDGTVPQFLCFVLALVRVTSALQPDICSSQFKWQDCGMPPKAVTYYYKTGSRCEVGLWRGCLPNPNMFVDEYECVQTCIFSLRAHPHNYHSFQEQFVDEEEDTAVTVYEQASTVATIIEGEGNTTDVASVNTGEGATNTSEAAPTNSNTTSADSAAASTSVPTSPIITTPAPTTTKAADSVNNV